MLNGKLAVKLVNMIIIILMKIPTFGEKKTEKHQSIHIHLNLFRGIVNRLSFNEYNHHFIGVLLFSFKI